VNERRYFITDNSIFCTGTPVSSAAVIDLQLDSNYAIAKVCRNSVSVYASSLNQWGVRVLGTSSDCSALIEGNNFFLPYAQVCQSNMRNVQIIGNAALGNEGAYNCIELQSTAWYNIVANNRIEVNYIGGAAVIGLNLNGASYCTVNGNVFRYGQITTDDGSMGIYMHGAFFGCSVVGNQMGTFGKGLRFEGNSGNRSVVMGNTCHGYADGINDTDTFTSIGATTVEGMNVRTPD
jgi:hypothetical protein